MSHKPTNILLQWRHIPSLRHSTAKRFYFRDVTDGNGWQGYSSVGIGISDVPAHGSFVLIVSDKGKDDGLGGDDYVDINFNSI